jgi:uncharacterized protein with PQ loop repeat
MLHHLHLRKRKIKGLEPYPARSAGMRMLDAAVYIAGIIGPLMALPQVILVYVGQDATGLSPVSWFAWAILDIPWILYGFVHKERPIIIAYTLWLLINLSVGIGAIIYG